MASSNPRKNSKKNKNAVSEFSNTKKQALSHRRKRGNLKLKDIASNIGGNNNYIGDLSTDFADHNAIAEKRKNADVQNPYGKKQILEAKTLKKKENRAQLEVFENEVDGYLNRFSPKKRKQILTNKKNIKKKKEKPFNHHQLDAVTLNKLDKINDLRLLKAKFEQVKGEIKRRGKDVDGYNETKWKQLRDAVNRRIWTVDREQNKQDFINKKKADPFSAKKMINDWVEQRAVNAWVDDEFDNLDKNALIKASNEADALDNDLKNINDPNFDAVIEAMEKTSTTIAGDALSKNNLSQKALNARKRAKKNSDRANQYLRLLTQSNRKLQIGDFQRVNALFQTGHTVDKNNTFGVIGKAPNLVGGYSAVPPGYTRRELEKLIAQVNYAIANPDKVNRVAVAAEFYSKFIAIHPFKDGNGRTSRAMLNVILSKLGLPPAVMENAYNKEVGPIADLDNKPLPPKLQEQLKIHAYEKVLSQKLKKKDNDGNAIVDNLKSDADYPTIDLNIPLDNDAVKNLKKIVKSPEAGNGEKQVENLIEAMKNGLELLKQPRKVENDNDENDSNEENTVKENFKNYLNALDDKAKNRDENEDDDEDDSDIDSIYEFDEVDDNANENEELNDEDDLENNFDEDQNDVDEDEEEDDDDPYGLLQPVANNVAPPVPANNNPQIDLAAERMRIAEQDQALYEIQQRRDIERFQRLQNEQANAGILTLDENDLPQ